MSVAMSDSATPGRGDLAYNAMMVGMLQTALSQIESNLSTIPDLLNLIDAKDCWRAFKFRDSPARSWNAAEFRKFIEAKRVDGGCETPIGVLERALRGTVAWETFLRLTRGDPYPEKGEVRNPAGRNQWSEDRCDVIIPIQRDSAPSQEPENRKPPTGTSTSYVLRQLANGRKVKGGEPIPPRPDLLEKVRTGELTPHAAAVQAGYVRPKITMEAEPVAASRVLIKHFRGDALTALLRELANWAGYELIPRDDA